MFALTIYAGITMVSNAMFYSGKALDVRYRAPFGVMILVILGFVLVSSDPPVALFGLFVAYALSGYVFWVWQKIVLPKKKLQICFLTIDSNLCILECMNTSLSLLLLLD